MISIGDSDWDESDDELVVTKPLSNSQTSTAINNQCTEEDIRIQTQDFFTWEDLQAATVAGNLELVSIISHLYETNCEWLWWYKLTFWIE